jgi:Cytochrome c554 and c-prime
MRYVKYELLGGIMRRFILTTAFLLIVFSLVHAEKPAFVGAQKCKGCHTGVKKNNLFEKWQKEKHANAFETLKKKGEHQNPKCLSCHTTGYNEGGYKLGAANASLFEGVQCEACHGEGSLYKTLDHMKDMGAAIENGLILPMESLCTKCHNSDCPSFKGFSYQEYSKKIAHIDGNK